MEEIFTPNFKGPTLKQIMIFELISWYGRNFRKRKSKIPIISPLLLDIGCGGNFTNGWLHIDFFHFPRVKFWKKRIHTRSAEIEMDLRYPINSKDNICDGIYSGHTIEHLYPDEAYKLLCELYRILKPGCFLRINFPDIEKYVNFYLGNAISEEFHTFKTGCEAICTITQNYGHHSTWDKKLMFKALNSVGFVNIKEVIFGEEGTDKRLIKEEWVRKWESIVVEAQKPI